MSSQRRPHLPLSPQQARVDSAADDYSDISPIRVLKTPTLLFPSCELETVRVAILMVRTAFLTQQGTGALSVTSTSAKLRTWKLEPFEYNGGRCIGMAFQGEMSNADRQAVILIENKLEHFQILIEARCRCSRG